MAKEKHGLGKGLGALLGEMPEDAGARQPVEYVNKEVASGTPVRDNSDVLRIPLDLIDPNPYQPRMEFDPQALEDLAASIRNLGIIQPISVRAVAGGRYQIISGERRCRASRLAGLNLIPAFVRDPSESGMLEMALVENIQRENLDPIETALSFQRLMDECSLTQEQMAERVGKKRASVANSLRLLKLPPKLQHDIKLGLLSVGHAKVLLGLDDEKLQEQLCDLVIAKDLSVRQLEEKVHNIQAGPALPVNPPLLPDEYYRVIDHMGRFFTKDVAVKRSGHGKGTLTIHFSSDNEIKSFLDALDGIQA
ncbi:MAG: ParB/RepB/Spo0J family partition protein [Bacteroidales bacterium]|nr:ParB/RepB/Spo0J family partition protein [Bacteroidales bacterium]